MQKIDQPSASKSQTTQDDLVEVHDWQWYYCRDGNLRSQLSLMFTRAIGHLGQQGYTEDLLRLINESYIHQTKRKELEMLIHGTVQKLTQLEQMKKIAVASRKRLSVTTTSRKNNARLGENSKQQRDFFSRRNAKNRIRNTGALSPGCGSSNNTPESSATTSGLKRFRKRNRSFPRRKGRYNFDYNDDPRRKSKMSGARRAPLPLPLPVPRQDFQLSEKLIMDAQNLINSSDNEFPDDSTTNGRKNNNNKKSRFTDYWKNKKESLKQFFSLSSSSTSPWSVSKTGSPVDGSEEDVALKLRQAELMHAVKNNLQQRMLRGISDSSNTGGSSCEAVDHTNCNCNSAEQNASSDASSKPAAAAGVYSNYLRRQRNRGVQPKRKKKHNSQQQHENS